MDAKRIYEEAESLQDHSGLLVIGTIVRWARETENLDEIIDSEDWMPSSDEDLERYDEVGKFGEYFDNYSEWCAETGQHRCTSNARDFRKVISITHSKEYARESEKFLSLYEEDREPEFKGE